MQENRLLQPGKYIMMHILWRRGIRIIHYSTELCITKIFLNYFLKIIFYMNFPSAKLCTLFKWKYGVFHLGKLLTSMGHTNLIIFKSLFTVWYLELINICKKKLYPVRREQGKILTYSLRDFYHKSKRVQDFSQDHCANNAHSTKFEQKSKNLKQKEISPFAFFCN